MLQHYGKVILRCAGSKQYVTLHLIPKWFSCGLFHHRCQHNVLLSDAVDGGHLLPCSDIEASLASCSLPCVSPCSMYTVIDFPHPGKLACGLSRKHPSVSLGQEMRQRSMFGGQPMHSLELPQQLPRHAFGCWTLAWPWMQPRGCSLCSLSRSLSFLGLIGGVRKASALAAFRCGWRLSLLGRQLLRTGLRGSYRFSLQECCKLSDDRSPEVMSFCGPEEQARSLRLIASSSACSDRRLLRRRSSAPSTEQSSTS